MLSRQVIRTLLSTALVNLASLSNPLPARASTISYLLQNDAATPPSVSAVLFGTDLLSPVTLSDSSQLSDATTTAEASHGVLDLSGSSAGFALIVSSLVFTDTLTFVSDTLPVGTLVDALFTLDLDYAMSINCSSTSVSRLDARLVVGSSALMFGDDSCAGITNNLTTAIMTFAIGESVVVIPQLHITAATGNCCAPGELASVDSTLRFFVDPIGSSFSYTSQTGGNYLTPAPVSVPEPGSLMLLGPAAIGLLAWARRKGTLGVPDKSHSRSLCGEQHTPVGESIATDVVQQ